jgi:hypothetical protein
VEFSEVDHADGYISSNMTEIAIVADKEMYKTVMNIVICERIGI